MFYFERVQKPIRGQTPNSAHRIWCLSRISPGCGQVAVDAGMHDSSRFAFPMTRDVREVFVGFAPRFEAKYSVAVLVLSSKKKGTIESVALDIAGERCGHRVG